MTTKTEDVYRTDGGQDENPELQDEGSIFDPEYDVDAEEQAKIVASLAASGGLPTEEQETEFNAVLLRLSEKYPGEEIYSSFIPYNGFFAYRKQYLSDLEEIEDHTNEITSRMITEFREKHSPLLESIRMSIAREKAQAASRPGAPVDSKSVFVSEEEIFRKLPAEIIRDYSKIDSAVEDASVFGTLSRCVLYPKDMADRIQRKRIPPGIPAILSSNILRISGWVRNVSIKKA